MRAHAKGVNDMPDARIKTNIQKPSMQRKTTNIAKPGSSARQTQKISSAHFYSEPKEGNEVVSTYDRHSVSTTERPAAARPICSKVVTTQPVDVRTDNQKVNTAETIVPPVTMEPVVSQDNLSNQEQSQLSKIKQPVKKKLRLKMFHKHRKKKKEDVVTDYGAIEEKNWKNLKFLISLSALIIVFAALKVTNILTSAFVVGQSMQPNYHTRDIVLASKLLSLQRYDVVLAKTPDGTPVIKRIIGMPGDKITYKNEHIYVNDVLSDESIISPSLELDLNMKGSVTLKADEYFVAGDNRDNSSDSRIYGPVTKNNISGEVFYKIPMSRLFGDSSGSNKPTSRN